MPYRRVYFEGKGLHERQEDGLGRSNVIAYCMRTSVDMYNLEILRKGAGYVFLSYSGVPIVFTC